MGWSDGISFVPLVFALLSSKNSQINGISSDIDKRCSGYKRRLEALETAPSLIPSMIERSLKAGASADYVLIDTWFTQQPLIKSIVEIGLLLAWSKQQINVWLKIVDCL
jgi:hypothetical protein